VEPIQPIGPREREVEPVVHVTPASRDGARERQDPREHADEQPRRQPPEQPHPPDGEDGTWLIDVRV
jgi:hypothetical protein